MKKTQKLKNFHDLSQEEEIDVNFDENSIQGELYKVSYSAHEDHETSSESMPNLTVPQQEASQDKMRLLGELLIMDPQILNGLSYGAIASLTGAIEEKCYARALIAAHNDQVQYLKQAINTDYLTNIGNRRAVAHHLEGEWSRAIRHDRPLSLLVVDIDNLKNINDLCGHYVGDEVIVEVAHRLFASLRAEDHIGRIGGDEFLVICPDANAQSTRSISRKLANAISHPPIFAGVEGNVVHVSIGYATKSQLTLNPKSLIAKADAKMYHSKRARRTSLKDSIPKRS